MIISKAEVYHPAVSRLAGNCRILQVTLKTRDLFITDTEDVFFSKYYLQ